MHHQMYSGPPPMGFPQMRPPILTPPYPMMAQGMAPHMGMGMGMPPHMGMGMPLHMGMGMPPHYMPNPQMAPPHLPTQTPQPVVAPKEEPITVYVGKIAKGVPDDLIKKILECCGNLLQWKRVNDSVSGELKAFGFAKYASPADVLSAIRILNGYDIQGQPLLLNVDEKTKTILSAYENNSNEPMESLLEADAVILQQLHKLQTSDSSSNENNSDKNENNLNNVNNNEMEGPNALLLTGDKEKDSMVSEQIKIFRDKQAQAEKEKRSKQATVETSSSSSSSSTSEQDEIRKWYAKEANSLRETRLRENDRKEKKLLRDERDFREKEKSYEALERDKERDRIKRDARQKEREKERNFHIKKEEESKEYWWKRFKDSRRRRERQHEKDEDERDRQLELQEIQHKEQQEKLLQQQAIDEENKVKSAALKRDIEANLAPSGSRLQSKNQPIKLGFSSNTQKRSRLANELEDDEEKGNPDDPKSQPKKKRVLVKLDYASEGIQTDEEKQRNPEVNPEIAKSIAAKIPAAKDELFAYPINWELVEQGNILENKLKGWVTDKIHSFFGTEEAVDLIAFILEKLRERISPNVLFEQLQPLLEGETEFFVKMLWRVLIFHMISLDPTAKIG